MIPFRSILVPVDFSEPSRSAVRCALDLAELCGSTVTLLHVYGLPASAFPEGFVLAPEVLTRLGSNAQDAVANMAEEFNKEGVVVQAVSEIGLPSRAILSRAENEGFDLIVMGTHGRTGIEHVLVGSVTERVVRLAPCPVLTVQS